MWTHTKRIAEIAQEFNMTYQDFTSMEGVNDEQFVDGFHGSDMVYRSIVEKLAENNPTLGSYIKPKEALYLVKGN